MLGGDKQSPGQQEQRSHAQKDFLQKRSSQTLGVRIHATFSTYSRQASDLGQWFLKCSPWISSLSATWELARNAASQTSPRPSESETLAVGLGTVFQQV